MILLQLESKKIFRFLIAGGTAATVEYLSFIVFRHLIPNVFLSNTLSFICGLTLSFMLNKHWVFLARDYFSRQVILYFVLACVNILISNFIVWTLTSKLGLLVLVSKLVAMALIAIWNYMFFSRLIFKDRHLDV